MSRPDVIAAMNRTSCECRRINTEHHVDIDNWYPAGEALLKQPGDFLWLRGPGGEITHILIWIPGDHGGSITPLPVIMGHPAVSPERWGWDADPNKPTLKPGIWRDRDVPHNEWHGHLTAGRLVSCP